MVIKNRRHCGIFLIASALSLTSCSTYGTSSSHQEDIVNNKKINAVLSDDAKKELGFLIPRPPLLSVAKGNELFLPKPGSERMVSARSSAQKKSEKDAYDLYVAPYVEAKKDSDSLVLDKGPLSADSRVTGNVLSENLVSPTKDFYNPAQTAPIDDKGLDEAQKDLLRSEDPNLKPTKNTVGPSKTSNNLSK